MLDEIFDRGAKAERLRDILTLIEESRNRDNWLKAHPADPDHWGERCANEPWIVNFRQYWADFDERLIGAIVLPDSRAPLAHQIANALSSVGVIKRSSVDTASDVVVSVFRNLALDHVGGAFSSLARLHASQSGLEVEEDETVRDTWVLHHPNYGNKVTMERTFPSYTRDAFTRSLLDVIDASFEWTVARYPHGASGLIVGVRNLQASEQCDRVVERLQQIIDKSPQLPPDGSRFIQSLIGVVLERKVHLLSLEQASLRKTKRVKVA